MGSRAPPRGAGAVALAALALGCRGAAPSAEPPAAPPVFAPAPEGFVPHAQRLSTLSVPPGFERVAHVDRGPAGGETARFEDGRGHYLLLVADPPGSGFAADAVWTLRETPEGGVEVVDAPAPCRRLVFPNSTEAVWDEREDDCLAGDGRLDVAAVVTVRGRRHVFFLGDAFHEDHLAALDPLRAALETFRAR
jgi:hypothetical protein